jgi:hypothetical protein
MNRLPLALMWLLALRAGVLSPARPSAALPEHASIVAADPLGAPRLFRPVRAERLQAAAPARPDPWRHAIPQADLGPTQGDAVIRPDGHVGRSPRSVAPPVTSSGLGSPRFPTGPPVA